MRGDERYVYRAVNARSEEKLTSFVEIPQDVHQSTPFFLNQVFRSVVKDVT
jgi:hypothetical protein